jgi:hypothetical protein
MRKSKRNNIKRNKSKKSKQTKRKRTKKVNKLKGTTYLKNVHKLKKKNGGGEEGDNVFTLDEAIISGFQQSFTKNKSNLDLLHENKYEQEARLKKQENKKIAKELFESSGQQLYALINQGTIFLRYFLSKDLENIVRKQHSQNKVLSITFINEDPDTNILDVITYKTENKSNFGTFIDVIKIIDNNSNDLNIYEYDIINNLSNKLFDSRITKIEQQIPTIKGFKLLPTIEEET